MQQTVVEKTNPMDSASTVTKISDGNANVPHHEAAFGPMSSDLVASLDAMQRSIALKNARVVAITSPDNTNATTKIAVLLARNVAASGIKTLLIDTTKPHPEAPTKNTWLPGEPIPPTELKSTDDPDYDHFDVLVTPTTRPLFNNLLRLQKTLQQDMRSYGMIIVNLSAVLEPDIKLVNPVSFARAADSVFVVCTTGRTLISDAEAAAKLLKEADIAVTGTIIDNSEQKLPGPEIAARIEKTRLLPSRMRERLANWLRTSELFNS